MLTDNARKILKAFREAQRWQHSGEAVLRSGDATGRVFFAGGKIAWATVSTLKRNFTTYMVEVAHLDEESLKQVFEECKRTGKNFGETIIEWGLCDEPTLRRLLLDQIAENLLELFTWATVESLFIPEHRSYKGSLTYDVAEVLQKVLENDREARLPFHGATVEDLLRESEQAPAPGEAAGVPGAPPRRSSRAVLGVAAVVALLAVGAAVALRSGAGPASAPDARELAAAVAPPRPLPAAADAGHDAGPADAGEPDGGPDEPDGGPRVFPPDLIAAFADGDGLGTLRITSAPSRAGIFVDGVSTGRSTPTVLKLPARDHLVLVLDKEGASPAFTRLTLKKGETRRVHLALARKKPLAGRAIVMVESDPPGANVVLDGTPFKEPTPVEISIPLGRTSMLVVLRDGYVPWVRNVRAVPDVKMTFFARLEAK